MSRGPRARGEAGIGLIETLLAVAIVGIMGAFAIVGLQLSIRTTSDVGLEARRRAAIEAWAATVKNNDAVPYAVYCTKTGLRTGGPATAALPAINGYQTDGRTAATSTRGFLAVPGMTGFADTSFEVTDVQWWNPAANTFDDTARCNVSASAAYTSVDQGVQRLTLRVTLRGETTTMQMIKRKP